MIIGKRLSGMTVYKVYLTIYLIDARMKPFKAGQTRTDPTHRAEHQLGLPH